MKDWGAPSWEKAREVAEEEVRHPSEVCETLSPGLDHGQARARADGAALEEQYSVYDRLMIGAHNL